MDEDDLDPATRQWHQDLMNLGVNTIRFAQLVRSGELPVEKFWPEMDYIVRFFEARRPGGPPKLI